MVRIRKRLHTAVVGDSDRVHAPLFGTFDDILDLGNTVHIAHLCVTVKLHSLDRTVVHPLAGEIFAFLDAGNRTDRQLAVKFINVGNTLDADKLSRLGRRLQIIQRIFPCKDLDADCICKIRYRKHKQCVAAAELP